MYHLISKILVFFITLAFLLLPAKPENLEITVNPVTTETQGISFEIKNNTNRPVGRPNFSFERNVNGQWESSELIYAVPEYGYTLYPTQTATESVWIENPESITEGEYRLTLSYRVGKGIKTTVKSQSSVIFTVN